MKTIKDFRAQLKIRQKEKDPTLKRWRSEKGKQKAMRMAYYSGYVEALVDAGVIGEKQ